MSTVDKAEKALEFLKNVDSHTKLFEIQNAAGTLGRCMATIGGRFNYPANYTNMLHFTLPTLLNLSSNDSAEIRLLSDEALNRCIASALPFHAYRINIMLQNLIDPGKSSRWNRAAISRVCIGTGWLRPGPGKIRTQAQTLIRKFIEIMKHSTDSLQLIMETMDSNLPRILNALANYTTDEEMADLMQAFSLHLTSNQPPVRRGAASCISILCKHREILIPLVLNTAIDELWPETKDSCIILGWFGVLKNVLLNKPINQISNTLVSVHDFLQVYELCLHYLQVESTEHNIHNAVLECLSCLIAQASGEFRSALLDKTCPHPVNLGSKTKQKKRRSAAASADQVTLSTGSSLININSEMGFASNMSRNQTPYRSIEDLHDDQTSPGTPQGKHFSPNADHITREVFEKLRDSFFQNDDKSELFQEDNVEEFASPDSPKSTVSFKMMHSKGEIESLLAKKLGACTIDDDVDNKVEESKDDQIESSATFFERFVKTNIGTAADVDVRLKYCTRLIASRFLLVGNKGEIIPDRAVRVSVKASALSCLSAILQVYPKALTLYLDKDALHNISGNSDLSNVSAKDTQNDFILERNVCYQDSLTESFSQDLLTKSIESQLQNQAFSSTSGRREDLSRTGSEGGAEKSDSLKDVASNILDSKAVSDLRQLACMGQSMNSADMNMTCSNITMNSNMTGSNNVLTTDYPQSTSAELCSSSMDLEMKFDHFGDSPVGAMVDAMKFKQEQSEERAGLIDRKRCEESARLKNVTDTPVPPARKKTLCRTSDVANENDDSAKGDKEDVKLNAEMDSSRNEADYESQHLSDIYEVLENHHDPQIRGLVRLCLGNFISSVICESKGDYGDWEGFVPLSKDVVNRFNIGYLIQIIVKGLSGEIHSCVNHSLLALKKAVVCITNSSQVSFMLTILYALHNVVDNTYWLCKVNLCSLYSQLPYSSLFTVLKDYELQIRLIMDSLMRLCSDVDQKVRRAASNAITRIIPAIYPSNVHSSNVLWMLYKSEQRESKASEKYMLDIVKKFLFLYDLPYPMDQLQGRFMKKDEDQDCVRHNLKLIISTLIANFMETGSMDYKRGILEAIQEISTEYPPWHYFSSYVSQGLLEICLDMLEYKCTTVQTYDILLFLATQSYCVEIWNSMALKIIDDQKAVNENISPPAASSKWCHLTTNNNCATQAEKFLQVTLKMLNILVHLIDDISPNAHLTKMPGIALPGSPVRRKTQDLTNRQTTSGNTDEQEDKNSLKKKISSSQTANIKNNFVGAFATDPFYMTMYDNLKAAYSNHKTNLDPDTSIFLHFISTSIDALAMQLEMCTEKEIGPVTEEILHYLKTILPLRPDKTVFCVTLLLKCLFGTNMANQYHDFTTVFPYYQNEGDDIPKSNPKSKGSRQTQFQNVKSEFAKRRSISVEEAPLSFKNCNVDNKNPSLVKERNMLIKMEIFARNKAEKKWETNKKELERYIKLLEPIVILALKRYSMQNDIPLQCTVLGLLNQLLMLRVNYCLLDRDMLFITFTLKQLEYVEQHEIPEASELVNCILNFLVHLSTVKTTNTLIDIPKLIQLCDGLMASGCHAECTAALQPLVLRVFSGLGAPAHTLGRAFAQELQVTREVVFYMLQKMMHKIEIVKLVSCVLVFSQEFPESYYLWSQLAADTLLQLIGQQTIEIDGADAVVAVEHLIDCIYEEVLFDQSRVEAILKIIFQQPPDAESTSLVIKTRWLAMITIILRKIITKIPETEILLSINYLKAKFISPASIFFNIKLEIDPLNVLNVNENCANLSPDVIIVRFLFRVLTYAITEVGKCNNINECSKMDEPVESNDVVENHKVLFRVTLDLISCVKEMLYLTDDCLFPLMAKTAQSVLHNEQSGLNTGLYSPDENIPLTKLDSICQRFSWTLPMLPFNWAHLLIRLKFLEQKYWHKYLGSSRASLKSAENGTHNNIQNEILQTGYVMTYCEYFVKNGLGEVVHLSWLLVNKIQVLVKLYDDPLTREFVQIINANASASGLLLQAIAARCHGRIKGKFALNTLDILKGCHESQSGPLIVLICLLLEKLQSAIAAGFTELAMDRCRYLQSLPQEDIVKQINKEDVQAALELLQKAKLHFKYASLVKKINDLSAAVFDLSPLDLSQERVVNPHNIKTTLVDSNWLMTQIKNSCSQCLNNNGAEGMFMHSAQLISLCNREQINSLLLCPDFNRNILPSTFKLGCDIYLKKLTKVISVWECEQFEKEQGRQKQKRPVAEKLETHSNLDINILTLASSVSKLAKGAESKSQFYIPITDNKDSFENLKIEIDSSDDYKEIDMPAIPDILQVSLLTLEKSLAAMVKLFPKQSRPSSFTDAVTLNFDQTLDRYTKRCYQVFTDKLFHEEFVTVQNMVKGYVTCLHRIFLALQDVNCEAEEKVVELILSPSLTKYLALFCVTHLQYSAFLIRFDSCKDDGDSLNLLAENVHVEDVLSFGIECVSKMLAYKEVWCELNTEANVHKVQSAINCLFTITSYYVQNTKPISMTNFLSTNGGVPSSDIAVATDKLLSLLQYWQDHFYNRSLLKGPTILSAKVKAGLENLLIAFSRFDIVSSVTLIPPLVWQSIDSSVTKQIGQIELPIHSLQDTDILEAYLFRVNLIGWTSKKHFEEIWMGLLGALQGDGTHWAVQGIMQLLLSALPRMKTSNENYDTVISCPRSFYDTKYGMTDLKEILIDNKIGKEIFQMENLEFIPFQRNNRNRSFTCGQFSVEYLRAAAGIQDDYGFRVRNTLRRVRKHMAIAGIDINSCLQLLMDIVSQMLNQQSQASLSARCKLIACILSVSELFTSAGQWQWLVGQLTTLASPDQRPVMQRTEAGHHLMFGISKALTVLDGFELSNESWNTCHYNNMIMALSSNNSILRQAAIHGCLFQIMYIGRTIGGVQGQGSYAELLTQLFSVIQQTPVNSIRLSQYEQALRFSTMFALVELGHTELIMQAVSFIVDNQTHFCAELVVTGVIRMIKCGLVPKELQHAIFDKLLGVKKNNFNMSYSIHMLMVYLFNDENRITTSAPHGEGSNMDPDHLMTSMERITILYKFITGSDNSEHRIVYASALKYFLRETLPPAAILSRVVIEFLECCKVAENMSKLELISRNTKWVDCVELTAGAILEVFETSLAQSQLHVLSGWLFEALCHLLTGKVSRHLLPQCLICLLVSSSENQLIRKLAPTAFLLLRQGFTPRTALRTDNPASDNNAALKFTNRRLLCIIAMHSGFSTNQLMKIKEICEDNENLRDLYRCLDSI